MSLLWLYFAWNIVSLCYFFLFFFFQAKAIRENIGYPEYLKNITAMSQMYKGVSFRLLTISVFWAVNTNIFFLLLSRCNFDGVRSELAAIS